MPVIWVILLPPYFISTYYPYEQIFTSMETKNVIMDQKALLFAEKGAVK